MALPTDSPTPPAPSRSSPQDTGAFNALQIGQAAYNAWNQATLTQVQALNNTKGYTILPCNLCPTRGNGNKGAVSIFPPCGFANQ
jgi:hypothetical protein